MPKTRQEKELEIKKLAKDLEAMKALVFVNYEKLKVNEINLLRKTLRENKVEYFVAKKTLLKKALKEKKMDINLDELTSGFALAFGLEDEVMPAKLCYEFAKIHENLKLVGGIFENKLIGKEQVLAMAKLPSKEELLYKLVYVIKSPVTGLVNTLKGNLNKLVYVLKAIQEKSH
ncbi:MAG: 50S ribosomal protein L10 [Patescibacteria group bacterium]